MVYAKYTQKYTLAYTRFFAQWILKVGEQWWRDVQQLIGNISMTYFAANINLL